MKQVHKICQFLLDYASVACKTKRRRCKECPATKKLPSDYSGSSMCIVEAGEFLNMVKMGNPLGLKRPKRKRAGK